MMIIQSALALQPMRERAGRLRFRQSLQGRQGCGILEEILLIKCRKGGNPYIFKNELPSRVCNDFQIF